MTLLSRTVLALSLGLGAAVTTATLAASPAEACGGYALSLEDRAEMAVARHFDAMRTKSLDGLAAVWTKDGSWLAIDEVRGQTRSRVVPVVDRHHAWLTMHYAGDTIPYTVQSIDLTGGRAVVHVREDRAGASRAYTFVVRADGRFSSRIEFATVSAS